MAQNFTNEQQQIVSAAIKKIDLEAESVSGQQVPAIAIYNFIKEKCKEDVAFAEKVLIETKKLSKCFDHIMKIAYNRAEARHNLTKENRVGVGMSSEEIMDLVVDYYNLDDKAIAQKEAEEKAKAKAEAEARKKAAAEKKKESDSKKKAKKPKREEKSPSDDDTQLSLF
jgi:hypothetical protein